MYHIIQNVGLLQMGSVVPRLQKPSRSPVQKDAETCIGSFEGTTALERKTKDMLKDAREHATVGYDHDGFTHMALREFFETRD